MKEIRFRTELQYERSYRDAQEVLEQHRKTLDKSLMFRNIRLNQIHDKRTKMVQAEFVIDLTFIGIIYYFFKSLVIMQN